MKKHTLLILFISTCLSLSGQEREKPLHWKVELLGALNNYDAWEIEASASFLPLPYAGISLGLLFTSPYHDVNIGGISRDNQLRWQTTEEHVANHFFALRPGLVFNSPKLWLGQDKEYALYLSLSPGLTIPIPANRQFYIDYFPNKPGTWTALRTERVANEGAQRVFCHIRTALTLEIEGGFLISAGYTCSNFDLYAGSRNIVIEGKKPELPRHSLMHAVSIGIGYRF